jgi:hypothetical protein
MGIFDIFKKHFKKPEIKTDNVDTPVSKTNTSFSKLMDFYSNVSIARDVPKAQIEPVADSNWVRDGIKSYLRDLKNYKFLIKHVDDKMVFEVKPTEDNPSPLPLIISLSGVDTGRHFMHVNAQKEIRKFYLKEDIQNLNETLNEAFSSMKTEEFDLED